MKMRPSTNHLWQLGECATAFCLCVDQGVQIGEMRVHERLIAQRPEPFGRLQFGRVGRQEHYMQPVWQLDLVADMPAGLINDQNDPFARTGANRGSEFGQHCVPKRDCHARQQQPEGVAGRRTDKPVEVCPCIAVLDNHDRALPFLAPDPPNDRFEADAMLILTPHFDGRVGVLGLDLGYAVWESLFLNASWASTSALA